MNLIESVDIFLKNLNENKVVMALIIILIAIYSSVLVNSLSNFMINLFENKAFKFIIFCIIAYISYSNQTLGIILAIATLVTLQIILNIKLQSQIKVEKFSPIDRHNLNYNNETYLNNPLQLEKNLSPSISNLNLNLENPNVIYKNMIKKGKVLLDDSLEMQKDLELSYDIRENNIYDITKRDGNVLVQSGMNRLQESNQGEYNFNDNNSTIKFIKFDKLATDNLKNPLILESYHQLQNNFKILQTSSINKNDFNNQLEVIYKNEIELLKLIYLSKMENLEQNTIKKIKLIFDSIDHIYKDDNHSNNTSSNNHSNDTSSNNHSNNHSNDTSSNKYLDKSKKNKSKKNKKNNKIIILHIAELVELLA